MAKYNITSELRLKLKQPLGALIRGSYAVTMRRLKSMVEEENPVSIICVGDTVSRNLAENLFRPKLLIVDHKCMRKNIRPVMIPADRTVFVKNPQGTITEEAETEIENALKGKHKIRIVVDGEEDLLALVAIVHADENAYVVYGQPYEGIVVVRVTPDKQAEVRAILKSMEDRSKS